MKVRIVDIHKNSAWYPDRKDLIGKTMYAENLRKGIVRGWRSGDFTTRKTGGKWYCIAAVKVEPVE